MFLRIARGGGRVGPRLTRPSPIEYFDLVSESYAVVAIFSVACVRRARLYPLRALNFISCYFFEFFARSRARFRTFLSFQPVFKLLLVQTVCVPCV